MEGASSGNNRRKQKMAGNNSDESSFQDEKCFQLDNLVILAKGRPIIFFLSTSDKDPIPRYLEKEAKPYSKDGYFLRSTLEG